MIQLLQFSAPACSIVFLVVLFLGAREGSILMLAHQAVGLLSCYNLLPDTERSRSAAKGFSPQSLAQDIRCFADYFHSGE